MIDGTYKDLGNNRSEPNEGATTFTRKSCSSLFKVGVTKTFIHSAAFHLSC